MVTGGGGGMDEVPGAQRRRDAFSGHPEEGFVEEVTCERAL